MRQQTYVHLLLRRPSRSFFASSTDHTTLLSNATVHRMAENDNDTYGPRQYILLPHDTPIDLAVRVDKLHLARIYANRNIIYGPKVVQRSLGTKAEVCKVLLDEALKDVPTLSSGSGDKPVALASLDGLCRWVSGAIKEKEEKQDGISSSIHELLIRWSENDEQTYGAIKAIATGVPRPGHSVVGQGTYRDGEEGWMELAELYVKDGMAEEGLLYQKSGGKLVSIDHLADTTRDGLTSSGGAMARFEF